MIKPLSCTADILSWQVVALLPRLHLGPPLRLGLTQVVCLRLRDALWPLVLDQVRACELGDAVDAACRLLIEVGLVRR